MFMENPVDWTAFSTTQKSTLTQSWLWYSLAFSFWSHPVDLSCPEADIAETHTDKDITIIKTTAHTTKINSTREPDILMILLANGSIGTSFQEIPSNRG